MLCRQHLDLIILYRQNLQKSKREDVTLKLPVEYSSFRIPIQDVPWNSMKNGAIIPY